MSTPSAPVENQIEIVTPENIAFQYRLAGPFQRLPAFLIDKFVQLIVMFVAFFMLTITFGIVGLPGLGMGTLFVLFFALSWFYGGVFETLWNGQTPGKRMLRLRVLSTDGQPINALQAMLRNFLRSIDWLPSFYLLGFLSAFWNDRFARLGDLTCNTMVIVEEPPYAVSAIKISQRDVLEMASRLPVRVEVTRSLALALSSYVARRRFLPWARRVQIARHVGEPLRARYDLPAGVSYDLLLCALYHKVFFADVVDQPGTAEVAGSPFATSPPVQEAAAP